VCCVCSFFDFLFFGSLAGGVVTKQPQNSKKKKKNKTTHLFSPSLSLSLSHSLSHSLSISTYRRRRITEKVGGARDPERKRAGGKRVLSFVLRSFAVEFEREERFPFTALKRRTRKEEVEGRWRNRLRRP